MKRHRACLLLACLAVTPARGAFGQTNSWINPGSSRWETGANWSLSVAPTNTHSVLITNANSKTIVIDDVTSASHAGTLTVSNLFLSAPLGAINTLSLLNVTNTPLYIKSDLGLGSGGRLLISNSLVRVVNVPEIVSSRLDGEIVLDGGELVFPWEEGEWWPSVGYAGQGSLTVKNGDFTSNVLFVGRQTGSSGTLTISGGAVHTGLLWPADQPGSTATVWVTGGLLDIWNDLAGDHGAGTANITLSNGTIVCGGFFLSSGTLTVAGGHLHVTSIWAPEDTAIWLTGGQVDCMSGMVLNGSNTFAVISNIVVCSQETYLRGGAKIIVTGTGKFNCDDVFADDGSLVIESGQFSVTKDTADAQYVLNQGTTTIAGGDTVIDNLIITNAAARFVHKGGTLQIGNLVLDPVLDADGDGIPNGYEQSHGLEPLNDSNAEKDSDGDGLTDLQEFLTGTDPTNSVSSLRITAVAHEGNNIRVTWMTGTGKTNALQAASDLAGSFAAIFTVTNTVGTVTNYLHLGAATNVPSFYYRVRLVP